MRLLLIGALPPPVGGTTVLFKQLSDELAAYPAIHTQVLNTAREPTRVLSSFLTAVRVLFGMIRYVPRADIVSFHASVTGALLFAPAVHFLCWAFRRKWIFRGFGGDFDTWHRQASVIATQLFKMSVLRADALLFERQSSTGYFQRFTHRPVYWYANSRRFREVSESSAATECLHAQRFVYVGHVRQEKGIQEILDAAERIKNEIVIDIYGPLSQHFACENLRTPNVSYKGILEPTQVVPTLRQYDVLLLPSYWEGEGYPGVILEAYCAGIPVIASRWGGIPEIVSDRSGILIEPRNSQSLADAMNKLIMSPTLMRDLRKGARAMAGKFASETWTRTFVEINQQLLATPQQSH